MRAEFKLKKKEETSCRSSPSVLWPGFVLLGVCVELLFDIYFFFL